MARLCQCSNCWGTAYEVARDSESHYVFYADGTRVLRALQDNEYSSSVLPKTMLMHGLIWDQCVQPSDVILHYDELGTFDHALVYIDNGIYFEMSGSGSAEPYRFVRRALESGYIEVRGFSGKPTLPSPSEIFPGGELAFGPLIYVEIPLHEEEGRTVLPPLAFQSSKKTGYRKVSWRTFPPFRFSRDLSERCIKWLGGLNE